MSQLYADICFWIPLKTNEYVHWFYDYMSYNFREYFTYNWQWGNHNHISVCCLRVICTIKCIHFLVYFKYIKSQVVSCANQLILHILLNSKYLTIHCKCKNFSHRVIEHFFINKLYDSIQTLIISTNMKWLHWNIFCNLPLFFLMRFYLKRNIFIMTDIYYKNFIFKNLPLKII